MRYDIQFENPMAIINNVMSATQPLIPIFKGEGYESRASEWELYLNFKIIGTWWNMDLQILMKKIDSEIIER